MTPEYNISTCILERLANPTAAAARFSMQPEKLAQDKGIDEMLFKRKAQSVASQMWEDTG
jgi:hypothetical protein